MQGMGPPSPKQREILDYLFEPADENKLVDVCCGRGFGKSTLAIEVAVRALFRSPHEVGLFLEPDWKRVNRVFLKKWIKHVPSHLYKINKTEQCITWKPNGSLLYYGPRNITGSYASADDSQLGQDVSFIIDDEAALRCSDSMYVNNLGCLRLPAASRFYLTISTPRVGPYRNLVTSPGHILYRGSSRDNPYLPIGWVDELVKNMSPEQIRREIDGEFISLEGRIWKTSKESVAWPNGNMNTKHKRFDPKKPWWLFCDLGGATGAYVVVQQNDAYHLGRQLFCGPVWVAVADLCPHMDASASRAFSRLKEEFGTPAGIVAGADVNTRSSTDGKTVAYFAQQVWGSVHVYPCNESTYNKQVQYDTLSRGICDAQNHRRFTIAENFVALEPQSRRGVREMLEADEYPDPKEQNVNEFLPKGKKYPLCHVRDALLMGSVQIMFKPTWAHGLETAA